MDSFYLGIIAGMLCTVSFIPQVFQIVKTKNTKSISLVTFILFCLGVMFWLLYGVVLGQWPIIIANVITLLLALIILVMKIKYG